MKIKILIKQKQSGLSLIELMVAITIFALITISVLTMYTNSSKNYRKDEVIARMQENGRFAIRKIAKDALLVDYWGGYLSPNTGINNPATALTAGDDCGIDILNPATALMYYKYDNAGGTGQPMFDPTSATGCDGASNIVGGDLRAYTNAIAFKSASSDLATTLSTGNVYIYSSGSDSGCILDNDGDPSAAEKCTLSGGNFWQYKPVLYVIRDDTVDGNTVPVLCRIQLKTAQDSTARSAGQPLTLNPAPTDCMAEGIEQMHLEFGLDEVNKEDLAANQYVSDITATDAEQAVTIRIYLLVRSATADWTYTNTKTYNMGSMTITPFNDNYYRRVYSTTVMLRNPSAYIGLL